MNDPVNNWVRMRFKDNKVWVAADAKGTPILKKGKCLIKYQLNQEHEYWVHQNSVRPLASEELSSPQKTKNAPTQKRKPARQQHEKRDMIHLYTDGACSGNPGPAGIGVLLRYGDKEKKISRYIGVGTNNIAELEAIKAGLSEIKNPNLPVRVYTDSNYAYGLLTLGWKPKKNTRLVLSIKELMKKFKHIEFIKVKGHSGHTENEIVDRLAVKAIEDHS